jgi:hypothetical protein
MGLVALPSFMGRKKREITLTLFKDVARRAPTLDKKIYFLYRSYFKTDFRRHFESAEGA